MPQSDHHPTSTPTPAAGPTDTAEDGATRPGPRDPVTGTSSNATGEQQATENAENDPVA